MKFWTFTELPFRASNSLLNLPKKNSHLRRTRRLFAFATSLCGQRPIDTRTLRSPRPLAPNVGRLHAAVFTLLEVTSRCRAAGYITKTRRSHRRTDETDVAKLRRRETPRSHAWLNYDGVMQADSSWLPFLFSIALRTDAFTRKTQY